MDERVRSYLSEIGRRGGRKSRRRLDTETARDMVRLREARRAFRRFHAVCFQSWDPGLTVTLADLPWIADRLCAFGGSAGREVGARLRR